MKLYVPAILTLVLFVGACSSNVETANVNADKEALQGTWRPVSMLENGKSLPDDQIKNTTVKIENFNFTFTNGKDSHGGLYLIDPRKSPKTLDIAVTKGKEAGKVYFAIYKFEDGKMIQCMEVSNTNRPTEFTGDAGSGNLLEVWEKVQ
jgi:uncharacterized protein (TIGR03067 family)